MKTLINIRNARVALNAAGLISIVMVLNYTVQF